MSLFNAALQEPWAIRSSADIEQILAIAERKNEVSKEMLDAYRTETHERGSRGLRRLEDVAILDIEGPLFKKANLFTAISGASSYEMALKDLKVALDDAEINGICLNIDSPGGTVAGCDELASAIYEARGQKPIVAFVNGMGCSAAYWIASAADEIVLTPSSEVGSIGVVMAFQDRTKADEQAGIKNVEFVSSNAPGKRPKYDTDEGKALIQKRADDLEEVFIGAVARNRGTDPKTIIKDFGAGGVEVGENAVRKGMADVVGTMDDVLAGLSKSGKFRRNPKKGKAKVEDTSAENKSEPAVLTQADLEKAAKDSAEKTKLEVKDRTDKILMSDLGKSKPKLAKKLYDNDDISVEAAVEILESAAVENDTSSPQQSYESRKDGVGGIGAADELGGSAEDDNPVLAAHQARQKKK
jgi:signal peptide peptidase SppA